MKKIVALCALHFALCLPARANWESGRGYAVAGGDRLTLKFYGGAAIPYAVMKNELGEMPVDYYWVPDINGVPIGLTDDADCLLDSPACEFLGRVNLGEFGVAAKYNQFSWAAGASVGMVWGTKANFRAELDWLHIAKTEISANPVFRGESAFPVYDSGGAIIDPNTGETLELEVFNLLGSATIKTYTDIISAMIYKDFYKGNTKPLNQAVPYIGGGVGFASTTNEISFVDYGDLPLDFQAMADCVPAGGYTLCQFPVVKTQSNNVALSATVGFSYGLDNRTFLDFGARGTVIPKILFDIGDGEGKTKTIFSATPIVFGTITAGIRFEF